MAFCNNCGKELAPGQPFCTGCGAKQEVSTPATNNPLSGTPVFTQEGAAKSVNFLLIIAAALMALGTLLPCYTVSFFGRTESLAYIEGDGVFVLLASIAIVVLAIIKKEKFALIPAVVSAILLIVLCSEASDIGIGSAGIGMYIMWIGAIGSCVTPFINIRR